MFKHDQITIMYNCRMVKFFQVLHSIETKADNLIYNNNDISISWIINLKRDQWIFNLP